MEYLNHFTFQADHSLALIGRYDYIIILLSYFIAVIAGYCAFSLMRFIKAMKSNRVGLKLLSGAALGLGIWSMHFSAMLAFKLPVAVHYDVQMTGFSVLPAIIACTIVLHNLSKELISLKNIIATGLILALGICIMHLIGMYAMSMPASMVHDISLLIVTLLMSWFLTTVTLLIHLKRWVVWELSFNQHILVSACCFAFSVASTHYLAMASVYFTANESVVIEGVNDKLMVYGVIASVVVLMVLFTLITYFKEKLQVLADLASDHHNRVIETIDNMQDGFVLSDEQGLVLLFNRKFSEYFGHNNIASYTKNNIFEIYEHLFDSYFKFSRVEEKESVRQAVCSMPQFSDSYKIESNDHKWWLLRRKKTVSQTVIQSWIDITEMVHQEKELIFAKDSAFKNLEDLKQTQTALLEAKKMASLGGLVSGIAHELNTPIGTGITALSKIKEIAEDTRESLLQGTMQKSTLDNSLAKIVEVEALAMKNLQRAANLIQEFKYISVGEEIEERKLIVLSKTVAVLMAQWESVLKEANINVYLDISKEIKIYSFENIIKQILGSLLNNSLEHAFTENQINGKIIIITTSVSNERLQIIYTDNGLGIESSVVDRIFEPFVTTKRHTGGVGLGLHIIYNLVYQKLLGTIKLSPDELIFKQCENYQPKATFVIEMPIDNIP